jgi:hypothetical protein
MGASLNAGSLLRRRISRCSFSAEMRPHVFYELHRPTVGLSASSQRRVPSWPRTISATYVLM